MHLSGNNFARSLRSVTFTPRQLISVVEMALVVRRYQLPRQTDQSTTCERWKA